MPEVVPARFREAREYIGLTVQDVATAIPCSPLLIEALEAGGADPGPEMLDRLGRLYRRPVAWLLGETTFQPSPGVLRLVKNLGDGDREAILDFAEFLQGATQVAGNARLVR